MRHATLESRPFPRISPDARELVLDCTHGRTTLTILPAPPSAAHRRHEIACVRLMLVRHAETQRCRCTRQLRRRYGVG